MDLCEGGVPEGHQHVWNLPVLPGAFQARDDTAERV
jgi:hypothetical protein